MVTRRMMAMRDQIADGRTDLVFEYLHAAPLSIQAASL
jgi:hypothetical protein